MPPKKWVALGVFVGLFLMTSCSFFQEFAAGLARTNATKPTGFGRWLNETDVQNETASCEALKNYTSAQSYHDCLLDASLSEGIYVPRSFITRDNQSGDASVVYEFDRVLLSFDERLRDFEPEFFMSDQHLNEVCAWHLDAWQRRKKCNISASCNTYAFSKFEEWCLNAVAGRTENITLCDKLAGFTEDCKVSVATKTRNPKVCEEFTGDLAARQCYSALAKVIGNPDLCFEMKPWCRARARAYGKNESVCDAPFIETHIQTCLSNAGFPPKWHPAQQSFADHFENPERATQAINRVKGTIMERVVFGETTLKDCKIFQNRAEEMILQSSTCHSCSLLTKICLSRMIDCSALESRNDPLSIWCTYARQFNDLQQCEYDPVQKDACLFILGAADRGKKPRTRDSEYRKGWYAIHAAYEQCRHNSSCIEPIAVLWLECEACASIKDPQLSQECSKDIEQFSEGRITCRTA